MTPLLTWESRAMAGTNSKIYLQTFNTSELAFKLQVFLHFMHILLKFYLFNFNKFVSIWKMHSSGT